MDFEDIKCEFRRKIYKQISSIN